MNCCEKRKRVVYEDANWVVEIDNKNEPAITISFFKDNHFCDDLELNEKVFNSELIDVIKDLLYNVN